VNAFTDHLVGGILVVLGVATALSCVVALTVAFFIDRAASLRDRNHH
jgi:hypothetical protein